MAVTFLNNFRLVFGLLTLSDLDELSPGYRLYYGDARKQGPSIRITIDFTNERNLLTIAIGRWRNKSLQPTMNKRDTSKAVPNRTVKELIDGLYTNRFGICDNGALDN